MGALYVRLGPATAIKMAFYEVPVIKALVAFMGPYMGNGEDGSRIRNVQSLATHK